MGGRSTLDPPGGGAGREAPRLPRTLDPGAAEAPVTRSGNPPSNGFSPIGTKSTRDTHAPRLTPPPSPDASVPPSTLDAHAPQHAHTLLARAPAPPHPRNVQSGQRVTSRLLCTRAPPPPPWKYSHPLPCIPKETRTLGTRVPRHTSHTHPPVNTLPHTMTQAHPLHTLTEKLGARSHPQILWLTLLLSHTHTFSV